MRGDESVLDAGCGTGRVTEMLLGRLPEGKVLAVDASREMVEAAREKFAGESRVEVERRDLLELEVKEPVDVVFSTAVFHWIPAHDILFARLFDALKPGGLLAAQCGGEGNVSRVNRATEEVMRREKYRPYFEDWRDDKLYAGPTDTKVRLEKVGFQPVETWLQEEPTPFESVEKLAVYLRTIILRSHAAVLPENERIPFTEAVAGRVAAHEGPLLIDYVRLNMLARRPA